LGLHNLALGYDPVLATHTDREGARLAAAAGFDAGAAARALRRLARISTDNAGLLEYFSSHPLFSERVQQLEQGFAV
jgi:predicted Zn-dependent protease